MSMAIVIVVRGSLAMALVHDQHIIKLLRFSGPASCSKMTIRQMVHLLEKIYTYHSLAMASHMDGTVFEDGRPTDAIC